MARARLRGLTKYYLWRAMNKFENWLKCYDADDLLPFTESADGLLWLKLKSIVRKEWLNAFLRHSEIELQSSKLKEQWRELFAALNQRNDAHSLLDAFIREQDRHIALALPVQQLVSELYKMRSFDWGGNYQNNLDRFLVDHYIKNIPSFDTLSSKIQTEIAASVSGYVLCSWYNHWSSILIEHLFKQHPKVLPTIGMIKKVDFFVDQVPFDLKVTYLPQGFIAEQRKAMGLKPELTELKGYARAENISFDKAADNAAQAYEITQKLLDAGSSNAGEIQNIRTRILNEAMASPELLVRWLYENQGERRFDASNRVFLVLVDTQDWDASWKLKRNLDALKPSIDGWLDSFKRDELDRLKVEFRFAGKLYRCFSDVIFVVR